MASKMEMEVELKSSADKFWGAISNSDTLFPTIFPEQYKSIEFLEGHCEKCVGAIRLVHYGDELPLLKISEEKIEVFDEGTMTMGYSVVGGGLTSYYKAFKATYQVVPKGEGCAVKTSFDYEKASDEVPEPDIIKDLTVKTFSDLDAYVLKN